MVFNSLTFAVFLPIVLGIYYLLTRKAQNLWLLFASCVFYGWWDSRFLLLLAFSTVVDYYCAKKIAETDDEVVRKRYLLVSLTSNLGILGFFKYFNFFVTSAHDALQAVGWQMSVPTLQILLPIGISFYTFQAISYTIDVYRRTLPPCGDFVAFALSVCYFPHLVAGPIQRALYLLPQLQVDRRVRWIQIREGATLIVYGLFKKVGVADAIAPLVDLRFGSPLLYGWSDLLFALYLFAIQIYCDFSGYSDIARGTSKLFGIELMLNFDHPYFSSSITEFWRRWHISLSTWLREYLYIPLGGNRHGIRRTYRNLMLTMLLGGLWHGANWTFVVWGALHGAYLALHKMLLDWQARRAVLQRGGADSVASFTVVPAVGPMLSEDRTATLNPFTSPGTTRMTDSVESTAPARPRSGTHDTAVWHARGGDAIGESPIRSSVITVLKIIGTFHLVCFAWVFFRADTLRIALDYLTGILSFRPAGELARLNWLGYRLTVLTGALFAVELAQYRAGRHTVFLDWPWTARATVYAALILVMLVLGGVDENVPFIYFQF